jgi:AcrR family transcriptional regulator
VRASRCYRAPVTASPDDGAAQGATAAAQRGLRLDAARNQERIVAAAAQAYAELGADVTLDEVARRAGVGVATVYRRFRNRDQLIRAVVMHVLADEIEPVAAVETDDPWRDLAATVEATVAAVAAHREVVALAHQAGAIDVDIVDRYLHRLDRLLSRARAAGLVRPELEPRDVTVAVVMVLATVRHGENGGGWRRYLALLLDGMRPAPYPLPGRSECEVRGDG